IGVAVNAPVAQELRSREAGDQPEHALLLRDAQPRLEAHQVPHLRRAVLLAQLHHGVGLLAPAGVHQTHRLHRAEAQDVVAAARRAALAADNASDVSGPVATIPGAGSSVASPRTTVTLESVATRRCTPAANTSRSTARAAPPGTRASSAAASTMLPRRRISA